jgi:hypothetical protein
VRLGPACAQTRFVGMMQYDGDLKLPARFLVPPPAIHGVSGKLLADAGVTTFACSETQKFGHVRGLGAGGGAALCPAKHSVAHAPPSMSAHADSHAAPHASGRVRGADLLRNCRALRWVHLFSQ